MSLSDTFNKALRARDLDIATGGGLAEETLRTAHARGEEIFGISLSALRFADYLGQRAQSVTALEKMPLEDLFLACACGEGDNEALAAFQRRFAPEVALALRQVPAASTMSDEIVQRVFTQLLFPDDEGNRGINSYRGQGRLFSWLRVIAVRCAFAELAKTQRHMPLGDEPILEAMQEGPDLLYLKEVYRSAFRSAFSQTLAELDYEARVLLRHHYVHGLSIDKLSLLHKIHRATAARRLAKSREELLQGTRTRLLGELQISDDELNSIMRLIASQLEASMGALMSSE